MVSAALQVSLPGFSVNFGWRAECFVLRQGLARTHVFAAVPVLPPLTPSWMRRIVLGFGAMVALFRRCRRSAYAGAAFLAVRPTAPDCCVAR
jgi:hypothetical protein